MYAPLPLLRGSLGTKMIEASIDAIIKMSDARSAQGYVGRHEFAIHSIETIVDSIVEVGTQMLVK